MCVQTNERELIKTKDGKTWLAIKHFNVHIYEHEFNMLAEKSAKRRADREHILVRTYVVTPE